MSDALKMTKLLPPPTAVRIAWAQTGFFSTASPESKDIATESKKNLDDIKAQAAKESDQEKSYVVDAIVDIEATMRSLDTIYKGRQLNIEENDKLRNENLENIKQDMQFGRNARDAVKSLPTMAITSGVGTISLNQLLQSWDLPAWSLWLIGLGTAGVGYFINFGFISWASSRRQILFVRQDYERDMFYQQYLVRVRTALINLYNDIDRLHYNSFNSYYPAGASENAISIVEGMLKGVQPTMCEYVHKHMDCGIITPDIWTLCETGGKPVESCKHWGK